MNQAAALRRSADEDDDANHSAVVSGVDYGEFLAGVHDHLKPQTYFEIGTCTGSSLALAKCLTVAVDPQFRVSSDVIGEKPACFLFQEKSDEFFKRRNLSMILGGPVELAFLDGLHLAEYLLRDFMNTERHCRRDSIIVMHDCLPPGFYMTCRDMQDPRMQLSRFGNWWTGDVWQVVPVLQEFRPDLSITLIDSPPTGLVIVTNLDPGNSVLFGAYDEIISKRLPRLSSRSAYDAYWDRVRAAEAEPFLAELIETHDFLRRSEAAEPLRLVSEDAASLAARQRNAACSCGSGKKFKHCHGRLA